MRQIQYIIIAGCALVAASCLPNYDADLGAPLSASKLKYTISQDPEYSNKVFLESQTQGVIPYWDYELGTSNRVMDTVIIPFKGNFWVKYRAFSGGGSTVDSTQITIPEFDPNYFADPAWQLLTNGEDGKYWKLVAVKAGSASNSTSYSDWGDVSWNSNYQINDSVFTDLDKGYHMNRFTSGALSKGKFRLNLNEVLTGSTIPQPGKSIEALEGVIMPAQDISGEMGGTMKNRFRIFKLNADTLVLGQGAYYTDNRITEDWTFFYWYLRSH